MKKLMWLIAFIPTIVAGIVLQFLPDQIPAHYDLAGNIDRWGSKIESFILPVLVLLIALLFHFLPRLMPKTSKASTEKEQVNNKVNLKTINIIGVATTAMFSAFSLFTLYRTWAISNSAATVNTADITRIEIALMGVLFIVLGNLMGKIKKNGAVGLRVSWSMYNDNTWRKSNLTSGILLIIAGILTVISSAIIKTYMALVIAMLVYLTLAVVFSIIFARRYYNQEKATELRAS